MFTLNRSYYWTLNVIIISVACILHIIIYLMLRLQWFYHGLNAFRHSVCCHFYAKPCMLYVCSNIKYYIVVSWYNDDISSCCHFLLCTLLLIWLFFCNIYRIVKMPSADKKIHELYISNKNIYKHRHFPLFPIQCFDSRLWVHM